MNLGSRRISRITVVDPGEGRIIDEYHEIVIDNITKDQSKTLKLAMDGMDWTGVTHMIRIYDPIASSYIIGLGGPNLANLLALIRTEISSFLGVDAAVDLPILQTTSLVQTARDSQAKKKADLKPVDLVLFKVASGDVTSRRGETYEANGSILYEQEGPLAQLPSVQFNSAQARFTNTNPSAFMSPGTKDFALEFWIKQLDTNPNANQVLLDYDMNQGTSEGFSVWLTPTSVRFGIHDGTNFHITEWEHSGNFWQDEKWHKFGIAVDRSKAKATIFSNNIILPTTSLTGGGKVPLNEIGPVNPSGILRLGGRSQIIGNDVWVFGGLMAGVRFSKF